MRSRRLLDERSGRHPALLQIARQFLDGLHAVPPCQARPSRSASAFTSAAAAASAAWSRERTTMVAQNPVSVWRG
jgi:hypothetical protein